ncbi:MAG TPA: hypothetical protein VEY71_11240 [Chitinophagales bacterium]|nr:hypothetical protein [Chitinophagales bacterium]
MACQFSVPFSGEVAEIVSKARSGIGNAGGNFNGDNNTGSFDISTMAGEVRGTYTVNGSMLEVHITDKPMFLPCDMIESQLKQFLK